MKKNYVRKHYLFIVAILGAVAFSIVYGLLYKRPFFTLLNNRSYQALVLLIIVYPIIEELAFRGFIQTSLAKMASLRTSFGSISSANIVTSVIFSAFHLIHHNVIWALLVFIPSVVFGFFRDKYGSVKPSIVLHIIYNGFYYLLFGSV